MEIEVSNLRLMLDLQVLKGPPDSQGVRQLELVSPENQDDSWKTSPSDLSKPPSCMECV
jgi:hypothetical protein